MKDQQRASRSHESIIDPADLQRVRSILQDKPRDLLLFDLATQTGIRMKYLLLLKVQDLLGLKAGDLIPGNHFKSDPVSESVITEDISRSFQLHLEKNRPNHEDYLFKSRKGQGHLTISTVSHLISSWFEAANIKGSFGFRSLHKTWELFKQASLSNKVGVDKLPDREKIFQPIETSSLQEKVYKQLFQAIVSGKIPPGTRLTTTEIAKQFKVSHMPVREAFRKLEAQGFITSSQKRASFVTELTMDHLKEITTLRVALESLAAELACKSCTEKTINHLEQLIKDYATTNDPEEFLRINKEFHHTIYRDARMPMLQQFIMRLWERVSPYLHLYILLMKFPDMDRERSLKYHQGMLEGMRMKDPQEVCRWVKADLEEAAEKIKEILEHMRGLKKEET